MARIPGIFRTFGGLQIPGFDRIRTNVTCAVPTISGAVLAAFLIGSIASISMATPATTAAGTTLSSMLPAAVTVDFHDATGAVLRSVTGTALHTGILVSLSSLEGAEKATIRIRDGRSWTTESAVSSNHFVGLAILAAPEPPEPFFAFPASGAFGKHTGATIVLGPGLGPDTLGVTLYEIFRLQDRTDFVATSRGVEGAAPIVDATGRFLGVSVDLSEGATKIGLMVPMVSVRVVAGAAGSPMPMATFAGAPPPAFHDPSSTTGMVFRGAALLTANRAAEARRFVTAAMKQEPGSVDACFWMGRFHMNEQQWDQAVEEFLEAARIDPSFHMAWHMAGAAYNQAAKYADAEKMYYKALEANPNSAATYCNLGGAFINQQRHLQAIEAFRKSIELDPRYEAGLAYMNLARTYQILGRTADAEGVYQDLRKVHAPAAERLRAILDGGR